MLLTRLLVLIAFLTLTTAACAIPRSDVLECGLSDGSKFILTSKYKWNPLNYLNPHGGNDGRASQKPFIGEFKPMNSWKKIEIPGSFSYSILDLERAQELCAAQGFKNGTACDGLTGYYNFQADNFSLLNEDDKFYIPSIKKNRAPALQEKLDSMNLSVYPGYSAITIIGKQIIKEKSLANAGTGLIQAVWQSASSDDGKTWSDPVVTTNAKIFEIGKSIYEQSFIARPISINSKKIEAHFPPQQ